MDYIKSIKQFSEYLFPQNKDKPETKCSGFIIYCLVLIFGEYTENHLYYAITPLPINSSSIYHDANCPSAMADCGFSNSI